MSSPDKTDIADKLYQRLVSPGFNMTNAEAADAMDSLSWELGIRGLEEASEVTGRLAARLSSLPPGDLLNADDASQVRGFILAARATNVGDSVSDVEVGLMPAPSDRIGDLEDWFIETKEDAETVAVGGLAVLAVVFLLWFLGR